MLTNIDLTKAAVNSDAASSDINNPADISLSNNNVEPTTQLSEISVDAVKNEYVILGDTLYAGGTDVPTWLSSIIDTTLSTQLHGYLNDLQLANSNISTAISEIDIARNAYQELVNINATIENVVSTHVSQLNATIHANSANITTLDQVKVTPQQASALAVEQIDSSLNSGAIKSKIDLINTSISDVAGTLAATTTSLESDYEAMSGALVATASAVDTVNTYTGLLNGAPTGTGMLADIAILQKQNDNIILTKVGHLPVIDYNDLDGDGTPDVGSVTLLVNAYPYNLWTPLEGTTHPDSDPVATLPEHQSLNRVYLDTTTSDKYIRTPTGWSLTDDITYNSKRNYLRDIHIGDMYIRYDQAELKTYHGAYKFIKTAIELPATDADGYTWAEVVDSNAASAFIAAANAYDLADGKRRTFVDLGEAIPPAPYDIGDLWIRNNAANNGELWRATTASAGVSNIAHWVVATKYTDDTAVISLNTGLSEGSVAVNLANATIDGTTSLPNYVADELDKKVVVYSGTNHTTQIGKANDIYIEKTTATSTSGVVVDVVNTFRHANGGWVQIGNNDNITNLADLADGKRTVFADEVEPTAAVAVINDIWIPTIDSLSSPRTGSIDISLNRILFSSHGMSDSDIVKVTDIGGTNLAKDTFYYVVNADIHAFKLSEARNGAVVDITGTGNVTFCRRYFAREIYQYTGTNWKSATKYREDLNAFADTITPKVVALETQADHKIAYTFFDTTATTVPEELAKVADNYTTLVDKAAARGDVVYFADVNQGYWYDFSSGVVEWRPMSKDALADLKLAYDTKRKTDSKVMSYHVATIIDRDNLSNGWTDTEKQDNIGDIATVYQADNGVYEWDGSAWTITTDGVLLARSGWTRKLEAYIRDKDGVPLYGGTTTLDSFVKATSDNSISSALEYNSTLQINGKHYTSGFGLKASGTANGTGTSTDPYSSEFWINAEKFKFTNSANSGTVAPFTIDASGATPQITFNGRVSFEGISNIIANSDPSVSNVNLYRAPFFYSTTTVAPILGDFGQTYYPKEGIGASSFFVPSASSVAGIFGMSLNGGDPIKIVDTTNRIVASVRVTQHRAQNLRINVITVAANGTLTDHQGNFVNTVNQTYMPIDTWGYSSVIVRNLPPDTVSYHVVVYAEGASQPNPVVWAAQMFCAEVPSSVTSVPSYAKGPDIIASKLISPGTTTINGNNITTGSIALDRLDANVIKVGTAAADINTYATTIDGGKITTGTITADNIAADTITADRIISGDMVRLSHDRLYHNSSTPMDHTHVRAVPPQHGRLLFTCNFEPDVTGGWGTTKETLYHIFWNCYDYVGNPLMSDGIRSKANKGYSAYLPYTYTRVIDLPPTTDTVVIKAILTTTSNTTTLTGVHTSVHAISYR